MNSNFINALWRYRVWIICCVISAATFLGCALAADIYRDGLEKQFLRQTSNIAKLLIGQFDTTITSMDDMLVQITSEYPSIETNGSEKLEQLHELLKRNTPRKSYSSIAIGITDKTGMVVATNKQYPFTPFDVTNENFFTVHASDPNHSKLYISTPQFGRVTHKQVIFFSRPLQKKMAHSMALSKHLIRFQTFCGLLSDWISKTLGLLVCQA